MRPSLLRSGWALALGAALVAGCITRSQPEKERFLIVAERPASVDAGAPAAPDARPLLRVRRVRMSPLFERKGFVYRTGETTWESDFYREFFVPPGVAIGEAVLYWLDGSPLFSAVLPDGNPAQVDWELHCEVRALYADLRGEREAVLVAEFSLTDAKSPELRIAHRKRYEARVPVADSSGRALADAWSDALRQVMTELEADMEPIMRAPRAAAGAYNTGSTAKEGLT